MKIDRHISGFHEQGYTVVPAVIDQADCAKFREAVLQSLDRDWELYRELPGKQQFISLELMHHNPLFIQFLERDVIDKLFSAILSEYWILYSITSTVLHPGTQPYTTQIHTDSPRLVPGYDLGAMMTIALDDFTAENGATYFYPGSHTVFERPSQDEFYANAVQAVRQAGDAVFFHPRVWHAGGRNQSSQIRCGFTVFGCRPWMKQRFDFPRLLGTKVLDHVQERGRRILGFDARVPANMEEFYRVAEDRLFKPGQG